MDTIRRFLMLLCFGAILATPAFACGQCMADEQKALATWRRFAVPLPGDRLLIRRYYPSVPAIAECTEAKDAAVLVEKEVPRRVHMGETYSYVIRVINLRRLPITEVAYIDKLLPGVEIVSSDPPGKVVDGGTRIRWELGTLCPEERREIRATARATKMGVIMHCGVVEYRRPLCAPVEVVQIKLTLNKTMPAESTINEIIPIRVTVRNDGNEPAENIEIRDELPDGLATPEGQTVVIARIGRLKPGQERSLNFDVRASRTGTFVNAATVTGKGGLRDEATATIRIIEPVLRLSKSGPERMYVGSVAPYRLTVANTGDAKARDVVVTDPIPENTELAEISEGGQLREGLAVWSLGDLEPGEGKTVELRLTATEISTVTNTATARARGVKPVKATSETRVEGIAALLLEVIDKNDPVRVGETETYVITVTNQGSLASTGIRIVCELEDSMELVGVSGPTPHTQDDRKIAMDPLTTLAPRAQATWKVTVRAVKAADARFKTIMTADQLTRPVYQTESTHFFK